MPKTIKHISRRNVLWLCVFAGGLLFLAITGILLLQRGKKEIQKDLAGTLQQVKTSCQQYDDYQLSATIKDLYAVINKINVLSYYSDDQLLLHEDALEEYAQVQYLTGIMVFDGALREECSVGTSRDISNALWKQIKAEGRVQDILTYPQKVVADRLIYEDCTYDYAVVSRTDAPGMVFGYSDTRRFKNDRYELSLENMLDTDLRNQDIVLVVTDGERVLSSNLESLHGLAVEDCPISNVIEKQELRDDHTMLRLEKDGVTWYGMHAAYRDYYLYAFSRANSVYVQSYLELMIAAALYVVTCFAVFTLAQHRRREKLLQMEKEYHLINAIASIYSVNLVIRLDTNTWEPITLTEDGKRVLTGIERADEMLEGITQSFIIRQDREEFRSFVDMSTMEERLRDHSFIGYSFEGKNGKWYQMLLVPQGRSLTDNRLTAVMLLARNVTEQKEKEMTYQEQLRDMAQRAAAANAAKTDFLRRMSHDIRTPINGIRGMAEIGTANSSNEKQVRECFDNILSASDFLLELVNNILSMSKLDAETVETEHEAFDLRKILQSAENIIAPQAKAAGICLECEPPVGEHWHLLGSPLNIQRVFQNIMDNAVKYNRPGGSIRISCRETGFEKEKATFVFACKDTGIGMSSEFQQHAFDTFAQEYKTARTNYSGSGLGLSIVKKTVELLGGTIEFTSRQGEGTQFFVTLPLKVDLNARREEAQEEIPDRIDGIRILMAEDNALNCKIATYLLTEKGASVTRAEDGRQAVELFAASAPGDFDVILMDIMMPMLNGYEAAKAIRAMERSDAKTIPIFALSANSFSDDVAASKASGMNEHISKPIDFAEVAVMIDKYMKK